MRSFHTLRFIAPNYKTIRIDSVPEKIIVKTTPIRYQFIYINNSTKVKIIHFTIQVENQGWITTSQNADTSIYRLLVADYHLWKKLECLLGTIQIIGNCIHHFKLTIFMNSAGKSAITATIIKLSRIVVRYRNMFC